MPDDIDLGASIAEAADEFKDMALDSEGAAVSVAEAGREETPEETPGATGAQTEVEPTAAEGQTEAPEGTVAVPDRYFEVDLSGLPEEERATIVEALKARDDEIGTLLRGQAKGDTETAAAAAGETETPPEPMTDDAILTALELDPENPFDEKAAKVALPLVRGLQAVQAQVAALVERDELAELREVWDTSLDKLETEHGELPIDRLSLLEFAASNGINDPATAFWRVFGPANRQVDAAVKAATARVAAAGGTPAKVEKKSTGKRPTTSTATEETPAVGETLRDTVTDAAKKVLQDLGLG